MESLTNKTGIVIYVLRIWCHDLIIYLIHSVNSVKVAFSNFNSAHIIHRDFLILRSAVEPLNRKKLSSTWR